MCGNLSGFVRFVGGRFIFFSTTCTFQTSAFFRNAIVAPSNLDRNKRKLRLSRLSTRRDQNLHPSVFGATARRIDFPLCTGDGPAGSHQDFLRPPAHQSKPSAE
jgi:hypothetical protein